MKRIKSFLTVVMAAIFALSLVPAGALAAAADQGNMESDALHPETAGTLQLNQGQITLANTKLGEQYDIYRLFELASFVDNDPATATHPASTSTQEAYSYVIRQYTATVHGTTQTPQNVNPWWTFLTTYGPNGPYNASSTVSESNFPYAVLTNDAKYNNLKGRSYFEIESETVTINATSDDLTLPTSFADNTTYHVIRATEQFKNAWDATDSTSSRNGDADGTPATDGEDYSQTPSTEASASNAEKRNLDRVQDFAQAALAYARTTGAFAGGTVVSANYTETGTGTNSEHGSSSAAGSLVVDGSATGQAGGGVDHDGNGYVPLGYYLVGTTMGSLVALDTTNRTVSIYEKNDEPTVEKKVLAKGKVTGTVSYDYLTDDKDGSDKDWNENTDADENDLVQFRTVVTAQQGARNYVLHDVMEDGLTVLQQTYAADGTIQTHAAAPAGTAADGDQYDADVNTPFTVDKYDIKVFLVRGDATTNEIYLVDSTALAGSTATDTRVRNWTLRGATDSDGCDFEIVFHDADSTNSYTAKQNHYDVTFRARRYDATGKAFAAETGADWVEIKDGDKIVVTYWAQLTKDAFVYDEGGEQLLAKANEATASNLTVVKTNGDSSVSPAVSAVGINTVDGKQITKDRNKDDRNTNSTILTYGANSYTKWDDATVTTYQFDITKTRGAALDDTAANQYSMLDGAEFKLYKATTTNTSGYESIQPQGEGTTYFYDDSDGKALKFVKGSGDDTNDSDLDLHYVTPAYSAKHTFYRFDGDQSATGSTTDTLVSEKDKSIHLYGLVGGDYVLVETKAPTGYNKLAHPIVIHVNNDADFDRVKDSGENEGKIKTMFYANDGTAASSSSYSQPAADWRSVIDTNVEYGPNDDSGLYVNPTNGGVQVINKTGQELPSTGGVGTTIFYVAGTVLVVGAVVMLVAKHRMGAEL